LFDFTGELKKLNKLGRSDRRSFMEQLENVFRIPAKVDLLYDFRGKSVLVEVPPVLAPLVDFRMAVGAESSGSSSGSGGADGSSSNGGFTGHGSAS
jgi:hypothetical protein